MKNNLLYSYVQTAYFIKESDSTLRLWVQELEPVLKFHETPKGTKKFTKSDIEKLKHIKKLIREDGYTLLEIKDLYKDEINQQNQLQEIKAFELDKFTNSLINEFNNNINSFKNDILEQNKLLIIKLLENQVELNNNISNKMETNNTNIINSIENMKNEICSMENDSKNNINDSLDKYFYEIKEEISEIKEKQDEIKTVYLSLEEVKEQDYKSKSWIEKLISKLK